VRSVNAPEFCAMCGRPNRGHFWWSLHKVYLRLTEVSLLWENCCSGECYCKLLEGLLDGSVKLSGFGEPK